MTTDFVDDLVLAYCRLAHPGEWVINIRWAFDESRDNPALDVLGCKGIDTEAIFSQICSADGWATLLVFDTQAEAEAMMDRLPQDAPPHVELCGPHAGGYDWIDENT